MSYCRQPYYIYPNIDGNVVFDMFGDIPDEVVNIFLYKLYNFRNDEFIERTELGRKALDEWNNSTIENDIFCCDWDKVYPIEIKEETLERIELEINTECDTFDEQWFGNDKLENNSKETIDNKLNK